MQLLKTKNKSALAVIGLTLFVTAFAFWLGDKDEQLDISPAIAKKTNLPDYFMEGYTIISTDAEGNAKQWLSGQSLQHFSNGNTSLTQPTLQLSQEEQHWLLSAEKGTIKNNKEQNNKGHENKTLSLHGNVNIRQLDGKAPDKEVFHKEALHKETKRLVIQTEHLDVLMAEKTATTPGKIRVSNENGVITATGLTINFDTQQLQLLSNVKGHYVFE